MPIEIRPDEAGPGTAHPFVVVRLEQSTAGPELAALPCPVIGIGVGPAAPFCDVVLPDATGLPRLAANITAAPIAAMVLVQLLRATENLPSAQALTAESLAYATLQGGPEFAKWRRTHVPAPARTVDALLLDRTDNTLTLTLNRPGVHNAINTDLRDALCEALDLALLDNSITEIILRGAGKCFCGGGDLAEFGTAPDPATAHWVRSLRLPATRLAALRARLTVWVHGASIGAGVEMAAFAGRVVAAENAWFQLPELKYGLLPGAGGTVSLPRRIGRQRTAYLALSMARLSARQAQAWGLVDIIKAN